MAWMNDSQDGGQAKPTYDLKGQTFLTVLPNTSRTLVLLMTQPKNTDPTGTWDSPLSVWVHKFKTAKGWQTLFCNKWNEACPMCFENEIFKAGNPNYKQFNQSLPYGITNNALLPVYDVEYKKVHWLLAGKKIIDGIEFIFSNPAQLQKFNNVIGINRIGQGRNTSYNVYMDGYQLTPEDVQIIQNSGVMTKEQAQAHFLNTTHAEIQEKMGIEVVSYFKRVIPAYPNVDINNWGAVPQSADGSFFANTQQQAPVQQPPVQQPVQQQPVQQNQVSPMQQNVVHNNVVQPPVQPPAQQPVQQATPPQTGGNVDVQSYLHRVCNTGMYTGKTFVEVVRSAGISYLQYLVNVGKDASDKETAEFLLANIQLAQQYIDANGGAF